jgi:hypothetical protein
MRFCCHGAKQHVCGFILVDTDAFDRFMVTKPPRHHPNLQFEQSDLSQNGRGGLVLTFRVVVQIAGGGGGKTIWSP